MGEQLMLFPIAQTPRAQENALDVQGLTYVSDFLGRDEEISLLAEVDAQPWLSDLKRRVQHYGYKYDYKSRKVDPSMYVGPLPEFALGIGRKLMADGLVQMLPDQMIVNEYMPGQGIAAHVDCEPCFADRIVTVSLGWAYEMDFIHTSTSETRTLLLERGSALVLTGPARYDWMHHIRARRSDRGISRRRRVSLTFRNVIVG